MAFPLPPWLNVTPAFYTQALEAGARAGIAVTEQQQRAQQMAEARAERMAQQAERQRQFEESRLLDLQRLTQQATHQRALETQQAAELAQLGDYRQQQARHQQAQEANQAAQESRLLDYQQGMLDVRQQEASQAAQPVTPFLVDLGGGAKGVVMGKSYHPLSAAASGPQHELGEVIPVKDKATGADLGFVVATGPNTGRFEKAEGVSLTVPQQVLVESTRARILQGQIRDSLTMPFADSAARTAYVKERRDALEKVNEKLTQLGGGLTNAPTVLVPPPATNAPPATNIFGRYTRDKSGKLVFTK